MNKKSYTLHFIRDPDPSGERGGKIVVGLFHDYCLVKILKNHNLKLTISKEEYVQKVITHEISLGNIFLYIEPIPIELKVIENSVVKDILSLQSNVSLSMFSVKRKVSILQSYIDMVESYKPYSFETAVIHEYAIHGRVTTVAETLNEQGYRVNDRKVSTGNVSSVLLKNPIDDLHMIVSNQFRKNKGLPSI